MKIRKIFPVLLLVGMFMASSAWADNIPEFDAVGVDSANYFAKNNAGYQLVIKNTPAIFGKALEDYSNFTKEFMKIREIQFEWERFVADMGVAYPDPCWGAFNSVLTTVQRSGTYDWWIVLQMQPESDLDLNIYDCVLKHQGARNGGLWGEAQQTGRWRSDKGNLYFSPCANPEITVEAVPGPWAVAGWDSQTLDARKIPGLWKSSLKEKWYTSKAMWDESIVIALPETGRWNQDGDANFQLVQGDAIHVTVKVPTFNTTDIYYGADSIVLKYIGMTGTEFLGANK